MSLCRLLPAIALGGAILAAAPADSGHEIFRWESAPPLPRAVSGQFAGVSNKALIVAGGSYFPVSLFEGGSKSWVDTIYVLPEGAAAWRTFHLDRPLAYGGSVSHRDSLILLGGGDATRNSRQVFRLRWTGSTVERSELPDLPAPVANTSAALLGDTIYLAGGQQTPSSGTAMRNFWSLDLDQPAPVWRELPAWPAAARILPVLVAQDGAVHLISGAELYVGQDGKTARRYLKDAWRYSPREGWKRLPDAPRPVVGAPAVAVGQSHVVVLGGDDGAYAARLWELQERHPGFPRDILAYHTITKTWTRMGELPAGLVTTPAVRWGSRILIPGGEDRPGHRSAMVLSALPAASRAKFRAFDYAVLGIYLLSIVALGVYLSGRNRSTGDFFLGGKRIPWWAAGLSIYGTQLSSLTFMAIPSKAYAENWAYVLVNVCILLVAPVVVFLYMPFFHRLNLTTAYEYLEKRFNLFVRLLCSALFVIFQMGRLAIVMYLPAIALATVSDTNVYLCILLMGGLSILYTVLGGIEAVVWTDVLQSVVLLGGALLSLWLAVSGAGAGWSGFRRIAIEHDKFQIFDWSWDYTAATVWVLLLGNCCSVLATYTTDQTVIQKYLTTADEKRSAQSIWTNALLTIPSTIIFFSMGTALFVYYHSHPGLLNPHLATDAVFPWFMVQKLPVGVSGLVLAGLFAAAQSTLSSSMHSMATALIVDFYRPFRPHSSDRERLRMARLLTLFLGATGTAIALLMATYNIRSLFDAFLMLLSLLSGSLAGVFALGIFTRRAHGAGTFLGAVAGALSVAAVRAYTPLHFFLYATVGLLVSFVSGYLLSLVLPGEKKDLSGLTLHTRPTPAPGVPR